MDSLLTKDAANGVVHFTFYDAPPVEVRAYDTARYSAEALAADKAAQRGKKPNLNAPPEFAPPFPLAVYDRGDGWLAVRLSDLRLLAGGLGSSIRRAPRTQAAHNKLASLPGYRLLIQTPPTLLDRPGIVRHMRGEASESVRSRTADHRLYSPEVLAFPAARVDDAWLKVWAKSYPPNRRKDLCEAFKECQRLILQRMREGVVDQEQGAPLYARLGEIPKRTVDPTLALLGLPHNSFAAPPVESDVLGYEVGKGKHRKRYLSLACLFMSWFAMSPRQADNLIREVFAAPGGDWYEGLVSQTGPKGEIFGGVPLERIQAGAKGAPQGSTLSRRWFPAGYVPALYRAACSTFARLKAEAGSPAGV